MKISKVASPLHCQCFTVTHLQDIFTLSSQFWHEILMEYDTWCTLETLTPRYGCLMTVVVTSWNLVILFLKHKRNQHILYCLTMLYKDIGYAFALKKQYSVHSPMNKTWTSVIKVYYYVLHHCKIVYVHN